MKLRSSLTHVLDFLMWSFLIWFVWGGYWVENKLKGAFVRDYQVFIALFYITSSYFFKLRFRDTSFGKAFFSFFETGKINSPSEKISRSLLLVVFAYLSCLFFITPLLQYYTYGNRIYDLGIFDNVIYHASRFGTLSTYYLNSDGHTPFTYVPHNHLNFGLYFFALLYRFFPLTEILLLTQSLTLAGSIAALFLIARKFLPFKEAGAFSFLLALCWEPFFRINTWDFHETGFACFFYLWAFYFLLSKRLSKAIVFAFLGSIWRADLWLTFSMFVWLGVLPQVKNTSRRNAIGFFLLGVLAFLIFPLHSIYLNKVNTLTERYPYLGNTFQDALKTLLHKPWILLEAAWSNKDFFIRVLLNLGFLFLFSPRIAFIALPTLLEIGLSTREGTASFVSHYTGLFSAPLLIATLLGWKYVYERWGNKSIRWIALSIAVAFSQNGYQLVGVFKQNLHRIPEAKCFNELVSIIPKDAALLAHDPLAARLSKREWMMSPSFPASNPPQYDRAEWLILPDNNESQKELTSLQEKAQQRNRHWTLRAENCGMRVYYLFAPDTITGP